MAIRPRIFLAYDSDPATGNARAHTLWIPSDGTKPATTDELEAIALYRDATGIQITQCEACIDFHSTADMTQQEHLKVYGGLNADVSPAAGYHNFVYDGHLEKESDGTYVYQPTTTVIERTVEDDGWGGTKVTEKTTQY